MPLPTVDFLGIGAQRAGTTWLYRCLRRHPHVYIPVTKELHYFNRHAADRPRWTRVGSLWQGLVGRGPAERQWRSGVRLDAKAVFRSGRSWRAVREMVRVASFHFPGPKDDAWYRRQFAAGEGRVKGEITPAYALLDDAAVRHVARLFPEVKVVFLLREPLSRMRSQWHLMSRPIRPGNLPPDDPSRFFASTIVTARNDYLRTIDTWRAHVPPERFFIGWYDDILADPEGLLRRVTAFLGVDPDDPRVLAHARTRDGSFRERKPEIPPEVWREMARTARPGIAALAERFGGHAVAWLDRCDAIVAGRDIAE